MPNQTFQHHHRVTYADCTVGNHIYYARYLDLLEAARGEFFRHLGVPFAALQEQQTTFPVVECRVRYRNPARYDDVLTTTLWLTTAGRVRLNFAYKMADQNGAMILEAETFHVSADLDGKPKRAPETLLALLTAFVELPNPPQPLM